MFASLLYKTFMHVGGERATVETAVPAIGVLDAHGVVKNQRNNSSTPVDVFGSHCDDRDTLTEGLFRGWILHRSVRFDLTLDLDLDSNSDSNVDSDADPSGEFMRVGIRGQKTTEKKWTEMQIPPGLMVDAVVASITSITLTQLPTGTFRLTETGARVFDGVARNQSTGRVPESVHGLNRDVHSIAKACVAVLTDRQVPIAITASDCANAVLAALSDPEWALSAAPDPSTPASLKQLFKLRDYSDEKVIQMDHDTYGSPPALLSGSAR